MSKQQHRYILYSTQRREVDQPIPSGTGILRGAFDGSVYVQTDPVLWYPKESSYEGVTIGAGSARSAQLAANTVYWMWATAPCHIRLGNGLVVATTSDFAFPANVVMEFSTSTQLFPGEFRYMAAIQLVGSALTGTLHLSQARYNP